MRQEQQWVEWKNDGCKPFIKEMEDGLRKKFWDYGNLRNQEVSNQEKTRWFSNGMGNLLTTDYKKLAEIKAKTSSWYGTDKDYTHMDFLDKGNIFVGEFCSKILTLCRCLVNQTSQVSQSTFLSQFSVLIQQYKS